jgi:hypothetical protein
MTDPTFDPPELLYHYTTASGLLGILEKKALWATDVGYLNDYMEVELSIDELIKALDAKCSDREPADVVGLRMAETSLVDHRGGGRFGPFVASFCESGDQLSQWRGYGHGSYALGFDSAALSSLPPLEDGTPVDLLRVEYDDDAQARMLARVIAEVEHLDPSVHHHWYEPLDAAMRGLASIKDAGFHEENEWRLYALPQGTFTMEKHRALPSGAIAPYIEVPLPLAALKRIVIGPGAFNPADIRPPFEWRGQTLGRVHAPEDAIHRLLRQHGLHFMPERSTIPYRT